MVCAKLTPEPRAGLYFKINVNRNSRWTISEALGYSGQQGRAEGGLGAMGRDFRKPLSEGLKVGL